MNLIRINGDAYNVANIVSIETVEEHDAGIGLWVVALFLTNGNRTSLTRPLPMVEAECMRDALISAIERSAPWVYVESVDWNAL